MYPSLKLTFQESVSYIWGRETNAMCSLSIFQTQTWSTLTHSCLLYLHHGIHVTLPSAASFNISILDHKWQYLSKAFSSSAFILFPYCKEARNDGHNRPRSAFTYLPFILP